jgi:hypothetical protein
MKARFGVVAAAIAVAGALVIPTVAGGAAAGGCAVKGTASFSPGLKTAKHAVSYSFSGTLSNCKASSDSTVKSGRVTASGSGAQVGCTGGNTSGSGSVTWNNGKTSAFSFTTTGAGNVVKVTGKFTSGEFVGLALNSVLAFNALPTACNSANGVTSATFNGAATI